MLPSRSRPRAPSVATLRILYQLAYISSGTAVGIGFLCAEERRRRVQYVQRIADNAKKLRQSPRYNHNVALATREENHDGYLPIAARDRTASVIAEKEEQGPVAFDLPSVVEREYDKTIERESHTPRNRGRLSDEPASDLEIGAFGLYIPMARHVARTDANQPSRSRLDRTDASKIVDRDKHSARFKRPSKAGAFGIDERPKTSAIRSNKSKASRSSDAGTINAEVNDEESFSVESSPMQSSRPRTSSSGPSGTDGTWSNSTQSDVSKPKKQIFKPFGFGDSKSFPPKLRETRQAQSTYSPFGLQIAKDALESGTTHQSLSWADDAWSNVTQSDLSQPKKRHFKPFGHEDSNSFPSNLRETRQAQSTYSPSGLQIVKDASDSGTTHQSLSREHPAEHRHRLLPGTQSKSAISAKPAGTGDQVSPTTQSRPVTPESAARHDYTSFFGFLPDFPATAKPPSTYGLVESLDDFAVHQSDRHGQSQRLVRTDKPKRQLFHLTRLGKESTSMGTVDSCFQTRTQWPAVNFQARKTLDTPNHSHVKDKTFTDSNPGRASSTLDAISADVDMFFELVSVDSKLRVEIGLDHANYIAGQLLLLALDCNHFDHVISLVLWKIAVERFALEDLSHLAGAWSSLASQTDHYRLSEFAANVLHTTAFERLPQAKKMDLALRFTTGAIVGATEFDNSFDMKNFAFYEWAISQTDDYAEAVHQHCRRLLPEQRIRPAVILASTLRFNQLPELLRNGLAQDLFDASLQKEGLSLCRKLILWTGGSISTPAFTRTQINAFISACGEAQAYDLLRALFHGHSGFDTTTNSALLSSDNTSDVLDETSYFQLGLAFMDGGASTAAYIEHCLTFLSESKRDIFQQRWFRAKVSLLYKTWKTTRNFQAVSAQYRSVMRWLADAGLLNDDTQDLHLAMVKICTWANQVDAAKSILSTIDGNDTSKGFNMMTAALTFAQSGDWHSFELTYSVLRSQHSRLDWDTRSRNLFDHTLVLFIKHHDAKETMTFCLGVVNELGLVPNDATTMLVLQKCVTQKRSDLCDEWIEALRKDGNGIKFFGELAAKILLHFYLTDRPHYILMIWSCRRLLHLAPSLACDALQEIVIQAISYDIRRMKGRRRSGRTSLAITRLEFYRQSLTAFSKPGVVWNGQILPGSLVLEPPLVSQEDTTNRKQAPSYKQVYSEKSESLQQSSKYNFFYKMVVALSVGRYRTVLELYRRYLDADGLTNDTRVLELAVEASLRNNHGNPHQAMELVYNAERSGTNITGAMAPLLDHQLKDMVIASYADADRVHTTIVNYYSSAKESGCLDEPKLYLVISAAAKLIKSGFPQHGLKVLSDIYHAYCNEPDTKPRLPFMTAWLHGYAVTRDAAGVDWVMQRVLDLDLPIDERLLKNLVFAKQYCSPSKTSNHDGQASASAANSTSTSVQQLSKWYKICHDRQATQQTDTRRFLRWLVTFIARNAVDVQPGITLGERERRHKAFKHFPATRESDDTEGDADF